MFLSVCICIYIYICYNAASLEDGLGLKVFYYVHVHDIETCTIHKVSLKYCTPLTKTLIQTNTKLAKAPQT